MKEKPLALPSFPALDPIELAVAFPGGFTVRDEANALTAYAYRNGPLETLHAGKQSPLLDDPELSRITDAEMKELMIDASRRIAVALECRDRTPKEYWRFVTAYGFRYCRNWQR